MLASPYGSYGGAPVARTVNTYWGAHKRIARRRGPARNHPCVICAQPAVHWALSADATGLKSDSIGRFSENPDDYLPMCLPCHRKYDADQRVTCKRGHVFDNFTVRGIRACRTCCYERNRRWGRANHWGEKR
jgi:hypothetical protein